VISIRRKSASSKVVANAAAFVEAQRMQDSGLLAAWNQGWPNEWGQDWGQNSRRIPSGPTEGFPWLTRATSSS